MFRLFHPRLLKVAVLLYISQNWQHTSTLETMYPRLGGQISELLFEQTFMNYLGFYEANIQAKQSVPTLS